MLSRHIRLLILAALMCLLSVGTAYVSGTIPGLRSYSYDSDNYDSNKVKRKGGQKALANGVVTVTASAQEPVRPLPSDLMCFNVNSVQVDSWHSAQFIEKTNKLSPSVLRIPGGEVANYWDWERGGIAEDGAPLLEALPAGLPEYMRYDARAYTASKIEDYSAGLAATNTRALFVLNMLTSDLGEQIEMLSAAARAGIEIKYLELGNEYYFGIPNYAHKFPTPEAYGEEAKVWINYLKKIFPGIKVSVFGTVPSNKSSRRERRWNQVLLETALPAADAISLHLYPRHGLNPNEFSNSRYPAFDEGDFSTIFGEPFDYWNALRDRPAYRLIPDDKEIWITEFNLVEDIFGENASRRPRVMGSWAHGLYALTMNMTFLEEPRIAITCNHDLVESFKFGAILPDENSFEVSAQQAYPVTPMSLSATGQALKMLSESVRGMGDRQPMAFSPQPEMISRDGHAYPALYGWTFSSRVSNSDGARFSEKGRSAKDRSAAVVINLSDRIVQLTISDVVESNWQVTYRQLLADPRALVTNENVLTLREGIISENDDTDAIVTLAPHSVTQIISDTQVTSNL